VSTLATWGEVAATAPASFLFGLIVGFVLSNRYRITSRNDDHAR
jgi:hypothetical protein